MEAVEVVERPERRVIGFAHRGAYNQIGEEFRALGPAVEKAGLWPRAIEVLSVFRDDPHEVPEAELRSLAGIAVDRDVQAPAGFEEATLPAGRFAVLRHVGPYEDLPAIWTNFVGEWLPGSGHSMRAASSCEIYFNSPDEVPREELITDLCLPVD